MVVGREGQTKEFVAHEGQLHESTFFYNALTEEGREGQTRKIELPDDEPETIRLYLHFLYTQQIPEDLIFVEWAQLYVFGQKISDKGLKNAVLRILLLEVPTIADNFSVAEAVNIIYERTSSGSLGRKLLVDIFHAAGASTWVAGEDFHRDFWQDLVVKFMESEQLLELDEMSIKPYRE